MVGRSYIKPRDQIVHFHEKLIHTWLKYAQKSENFGSSWDEDWSSVQRCFGSRWAPSRFPILVTLTIAFQYFDFYSRFSPCYQYSKFHSTPRVAAPVHKLKTCKRR
jgi:hypothetical protein